MHHFGEDAVEVHVTDDDFTISFTNHLTGKKIILTGPVEGVFSSPDRKLAHGDAHLLGMEIAHVLRRVTS